MIDDSQDRPQGDTFAVHPRDNSGRPLPALVPPIPAAGWTVDAVHDTALAYALANEAAIEIPARRLYLAAKNALLNALPLDIQRAEIHERLRGIDRFTTAFPAVPRTPPAQTPAPHNEVDFPF